MTTDHMYPRHNWNKFTQHVQTHLSPNAKAFCELFCIFPIYIKFCAFWKKDQLLTLNTLEAIDSEKYGSFNGRKLLFQNTLRESTGSRVPNTDEICAAALLPSLSINLRVIELENIFLSQTWNLRIYC